MGLGCWSTHGAWTPGCGPTVPKSLEIPYGEVSGTSSPGIDTSWWRHGQVTSEIAPKWSQPLGKPLPRQLPSLG